MRRGETQPQSETLRHKRSFNRTNTNVFREQKTERKSRAPKQCSSPRKPGERWKVPRGSREMTQSGGDSKTQKTWSWIRGRTCCGVRKGYRKRDSNRDWTDKIAVTPQEKGRGPKSWWAGVCVEVGTGVGGWSLRSSENLFHSMFCASLQQCTVNTQKMFAESERPKTQWWGNNKSSGLCPDCFTCINSCNSMRLYQCDRWQDTEAQAGVGVHNESPQEAPPWYADYLELRGTWASGSRETSAPPLTT